jgi:hypothetical protein
MVELIHIHEDDWGLRNLYPLAAFGEAEAELRMAREFGERHRDPSGFGSWDIYVIKGPSVDYASIPLAFEDAAKRLEPIMPRVRRFYATASAGFDLSKRDAWSSYEEDAWCFGRSENCFVKLDGEDDLVRRIWFELRGRDPDDIAALRKAIEAIDALVPSVIVDYWLDQAGAVGEADFLDRYFAAHLGED